MKKISKTALVSFVIGLAYLIYACIYFFGTSAGGTEQAGAIIATAIVMPHIIATGIAVIFNGLGTFMQKRACVLVGAIMYAVAMVLFPMYFMFVVIEMVLSFIGYARMKSTQA